MERWAHTDSQKTPREWVDSKTYFAATHCNYLGYIVGGGEVRMEKSKVEAVQKFPVPITKKDVRAYSWE